MKTLISKRRAGSILRRDYGCQVRALQGVLALCAVLTGAQAAEEAKTARKPNILFILTEDQGAHLGGLGTPGLQTPRIDGLARRGLVFSNAFVAYPVCSSSKACLYTGRHNHDTGLLNNTPNYHKRVDQLTPQERSQPLYVRNRIRAEIPTLTERLREAGYYQGCTHKLHVAPVEKFPYDEFLANPTGEVMAGFLRRAVKTGKPWFLLYNIPDTHRPYPNSDKEKIRVDPAAVKLPAYLPDTPVVRKDWAEYLAGIEAADALVGQALDTLRASGEGDRTIIVFMGDHGPTFQHGKMTPYDLGLRIPFIWVGPNIRLGRTDALASELDLMPTLLDLVGLQTPKDLHGVSLRAALEGRKDAKTRDLVFAEISNKGNLPNNGMQERAVFDGRWKLIYREKTDPPWRQVQADSKEWPKWGNRTYDETVRVKEQFQEAYRVLQGLDPQHLGGKVPALELYDLKADPDEMRDLAAAPACSEERVRLLAALRQWVKDTRDPAVTP